MTPGPSAPMTAVVLAGDRGGEDPVAREAGVACRALVPVGGRPMVLRVIEALRASGTVGPVLLCGPVRDRLETCDPLRELVDRGDVTWLAPAASPCLSVDAALQTLPEDVPVLVTTADHALLDEGIVDFFCTAAQSGSGDVAVGLARHVDVLRAFPGVRRTAYRFRDGAWCGCNLFALLSPRARQVPQFWRQVEQLRKRPLKVVGIFGWGNLLRYLIRRLTMPQALERISSKMGAVIRPVVLEDPHAAVDVDSVADWSLAQARVEAHPPSGSIATS